MQCRTCGADRVVRVYTCEECKEKFCYNCRYYIDIRDRDFRKRYQYLKKSLIKNNFTMSYQASLAKTHNKNFNHKTGNYPYGSNLSETISANLFNVNDWLRIKTAAYRRYQNGDTYAICAKCFLRHDKEVMYTSHETRACYTPDTPLNINLLKTFNREIVKNNDVIVLFHDHETRAGVEQLMIDYIKCFGSSNLMFFMELFSEITEDYSKKYLIYEKLFAKRFKKGFTTIPDIINSYTVPNLTSENLKKRGFLGSHMPLIEYLEKNHPNLLSFPMENYETYDSEIEISKDLQGFFNNYAEFSKKNKDEYIAQTSKCRMQISSEAKFRSSRRCNLNMARNVKRFYDLINMERKRNQRIKAVVIIGAGHHGPYPCNEYKMTFTKAMRLLFPGSQYNLALGKAFGHHYMQQLLLPGDNSETLKYNNLDFHINFQRHDGIAYYDELIKQINAKKLKGGLPFDIRLKYSIQRMDFEFFEEDI
ncbi:MAG: hypothetical protein GY750_01200 [Lentisphaerae bacterium]|nr:hypothetical protein [Lentisphaerota bacterium]MCP4100035.1 hypothetical protein [Lentisphaerota bacterium]